MKYSWVVITNKRQALAWSLLVSDDSTVIELIIWHQGLQNIANKTCPVNQVTFALLVSRLSRLSSHLHCALVICAKDFREKTCACYGLSYKFNLEYCL